jgi:hypothetical protein
VKIADISWKLFWGGFSRKSELREIFCRALRAFSQTAQRAPE